MSLGDGVLKLGNALTNSPTERSGHVVGFEVDELAGKAPFKVRYLGFDLLGSFLCRCGALGLGRRFEAGAPVPGAFGTEGRGGKEREQRVIEPLLIQIHVRRMISGMSFERWWDG